MNGALQDSHVSGLHANLEEIDALFIYEGDETSYTTLFQWLDSNTTRFLVIIKEEERDFLEAKMGAFAQDPRVRVALHGCDLEALCRSLAWEFVFLRFAYFCPHPHFQERAAVFFQQLELVHRGIDLLAAESQDMGVQVMRNVLTNAHHLLRSVPLYRLENSCRGIPAIVCGAGPSLDAVLPALAKVKHRALLIAGGSAVHIVTQAGIFPHIQTYVDPSPPRDRFFAQSADEVPCFYQSRFNASLLDTVVAPLVWIPSNGYYPLETWIAKECGLLTESFESGWTGGNTSAAIAAYLGCDPIIFVGMDFACRKDTIYAGGVVGEENREGLVPVTADLYSKKDWLMGAEWMGQLVARYPNRCWMNTSTDGIELSGMTQSSFAEIVDKILTKQEDVESHLHALLAQTPCCVLSSEKIETVIQQLVSSFSRCRVLASQLVEIWGSYYPDSPLEKGEYLLLETELEQEVCYLYFLLPLWDIWKYPILRAAASGDAQRLHRLLFFQQVLEVHCAQ